MFTFALAGAGNRSGIYADLILQSGLGTVVAVADPKDDRREALASRVGARLRFSTAEEMLANERLADVCVIATLDGQHFSHAMRALELGYDLLLEKPISPDVGECVAIAQRAKALGRRVIVCHVLRYTPLYRTVKALIDAGDLGRLIDIQHNENIGNFHMAHSFVRGNWRNTAMTSPILLAKCCHDMDLLVWLTGSRCESIASFGGLAYFRAENAPAGSAARCVDCPVAANCRYDARKCYLPALGEWPTDVLCVEQTEEAVLQALATGPYGRCVYRCDNDVCDHQVAAIAFENGVTASFNMSAFTSRICRTTKLMLERGEMRFTDQNNEIELTEFPSNGVARMEKRVIVPERIASGHGGGDSGLIEAFLAEAQGLTSASTDLEHSVESHLMCFAAEQSRLSGQTVRMADYRQSLGL